jgi:hypothetical protein
MFFLHEFLLCKCDVCKNAEKRIFDEGAKPPAALLATPIRAYPLRRYWRGVFCNAK